MVDAVNQQPQSRGTILPQLLLTTAGAGIGGHYVGRQMNTKDVLKADKFELSAEKFAALTKEEQTHVTIVENNRAKLKGDTLSTESEKSATRVFEQNESLPVEKYLNKHGISSAEALEANITKFNTEISTNTQEITTISEQIAQTSDEAAKADLTKKLTESQGNLKAAQTHLDEATRHSTLVESAKGGVVKKEAFKASELKHLEGSTTKNIETALEKLKGHLPKKFSWGKAGIGAVAGLVAGIIVARMIAPSTPEA